MFNSSLTSSISGWWSQTFSNDPKDEKEAKKEEPEEKQEEEIASNDSENLEKGEAKENDEDGVSTPGDKEEESGSGLPMSPEEMQKKLSDETQKMMSSAVTFGNFLFGVATEASKKVTERMAETATTIKKTVEEKSIIGDLNREQKEFLEKKRERQIGDASVPPWVGYQEADAMKQQILALSTDKRNFLRSPPAGLQFNFDFDRHFPVAMATLKEDENLQKMRFELVPKSLKEEVFWRNYFYRVSLIKESAQLLTIAEMTRSTSDQPSSSSASSTSSAVIIGSTNTGTTLSRSSSSKSLNKTDSETPSPYTKRGANEALENLNDMEQEGIGGVGPEFVSDAFDPSELNPDDLEREMKQLGMEDGGGPDGEIPAWEQELQKELQDYEVVNNENTTSEAWEKEIEDMLNDEAKK